MKEDSNILDKTAKMTKQNKALLFTAGGAAAFMAGYYYYHCNYRNPAPKKSGSTTSQDKTDAQAVQSIPSPSGNKGKESKDPKVK
ncbi:uncharacterized protein LOC135090542 [Scylla paramamosain]|uniref:Scyreprocin n=1 Tax=Scylla paramamosain TaxID=85552 RepID=A0A7D0GB18_SCYPA|nr:scyreprocin [Scylla paramamosain]